MKLKDYEIPQWGLNDGLGQEDLAQYSLKNFDLKAYQRAEKLPASDPIPAPCDPYLLNQEIDSSSPLAAAPVAPSLNPLSQPALDPREVQFGLHFNLQQPLYIPASASQSWKIPRWVVMMVGLFFGSAVVLTVAVCVVLLRDPKAPPTVQSAVPTAPVATTPAAPARPTPPDPSGPVTANLMHHDSALDHRIVVSRHPSFVRRQSYGPRRVVSRSTSSSVEPQETETARRPPPQDALDKLLGESSL